MYYVSLLALGDNVISLSLLSKLKGKVKVLGTNSTIKVAELMGLDSQLSITPLFDDIPAFYDIRKQGLKKAITDIMAFRKFLKDNNIKKLIFEKKDFRAYLLTLGLGVLWKGASLDENVYDSRKSIIEESLREYGQIQFDTYMDFSSVQNVLIAPVSRLDEKCIKPEDLRALISVLKNKFIEIELLDYSGDYSDFKSDVDNYIHGTSLAEVKSLLLSSDLYIGADSFLIHLAYFFKKPFFVVFNKANEEFMTPATIKNDSSFLSISGISEERIVSKFFELGIIR